MGTYDHTLRLRRPLNFEVRALYQLCLRMSDGGNPSLTTLAVVRIEILDVPEPPLFPVERYVARLATALAAGATLMELGATSEDYNAGPVEYTIASGPGVPPGVVVVDASKSVLRLVMDVQDLLGPAPLQRRDAPEPADANGRRNIRVPSDRPLPAAPMNITLRATGSNGLSTDVSVVLDVYHGCPPSMCMPWPPTLEIADACSRSMNASVAPPTCT